MNHEWTYPLRLVSNYDGDTFRGELDLGFGLLYRTELRLAAVDTPELRGGTKATRAAARLARDEAQRFILSGDAMFRCTSWSGKYGRPAGEIWVDGVSLADFLVKERLAVPYDGSGNRRGLMHLHKFNAAGLKKFGRITF